MAAKVVNLASLNQDLTAVAARIPSPGETILGTELRYSLGGKGGNQAIACSRLGAEVSVIAAVGEDANGEEYLSFLKHEGVCTEHIAVIDNQPTGLALIEVDEHGQNSILVVPGANSAIPLSLVDDALPSIRVAGAVMSQLEVPFDCVERLFLHAKDAGVPTILNPAPARFAAEIQNLLELTDILVPNEVEVSQMIGREIHSVEELPGALAPLFDYGIKWVIVTLGSAGCAVLSPDTFVVQPTYEACVVDTTAAGDSFIGALAAHIAQAETLDAEVILEGVDEGNKTASITVSRRGAQSSLPTRLEVRSLVASLNAP